MKYVKFAFSRKHSVAKDVPDGKCIRRINIEKHNIDYSAFNTAIQNKFNNLNV